MKWPKLITPFHVAIINLGKKNDSISKKAFKLYDELLNNNFEVIIDDTENNPSNSDIKTMLFGWKVLKHVKSNGILIVKDNTTVGVGAGQVSRVDSVDIAMKKSGESIKDSILCSDAFFPFRDSIDKIAGSGIKAVLQPGGSVRDDEVISACNEHGIAMVFTGQRCFKH